MLAYKIFFIQSVTYFGIVLKNIYFVVMEDFGLDWKNCILFASDGARSDTYFLNILQLIIFSSTYRSY